MKVGDLRDYPDDTEILVESKAGMPPQPADEWVDSILFDDTGQHPAIVVYPLEGTR